MVSQYSMLSFERCLDLDCYTFKKLLINAFITKMRGSKEGQDYLEECYILTQTDMETDKLKNLIERK